MTEATPDLLSGYPEKIAKLLRVCAAAESALPGPALLIAAADIIERGTQYDEGLEPETMDRVRSLSGIGWSAGEVATMSLAVSMKRIADVIAGDSKTLGIGDMIGDISNKMTGR